MTSTNEVILKLCIMDKVRKAVRPSRVYWTETRSVHRACVSLAGMDVVAGFMLQTQGAPGACVWKQPDRADVEIPMRPAHTAQDESVPHAARAYVWDRPGPTVFIMGGTDVILEFTGMPVDAHGIIVLYACVTNDPVTSSAEGLLTMDRDVDADPNPGRGVCVYDMDPMRPPPLHAAIASVKWSVPMNPTHAFVLHGYGLCIDACTTQAVCRGAFGHYDPSSKTCTLYTGTPFPVYHLPAHPRITHCAVLGTMTT